MLTNELRECRRELTRAQTDHITSMREHRDAMQVMHELSIRLEGQTIQVKDEIIRLSIENAELRAGAHE